MVKKAYWKNILRTVRSTFSRFAAIFAIVALGSGFLAGVLASPLDMRISADSFCDDTDMFDLRIVSTLGLTQDDIEAISQIEGVAAVMPAYDTDLVLLSGEGDAYTARIHSLPPGGSPELNNPVWVEGQPPENPGECAVILTKTFTKNDWMGQTFTVDPEEEMDSLCQRFTVTGTARSSLYISLENERTTAGTGSIDLKIFTVPESFDQDYYTAAYVSLDDAKNLNSFEAEYEALTEHTTDLLEPLGEECAQLRYEEILDEANTELADARQEYDDAKAEAEDELAKARQELEDGEKEIADNEDKLAQAVQELEDGRKELADGRAEFQSQTASARQQIDEGRAQIASYQAQIDSGRGLIVTSQQQLTAGYTELEAAEAQLAQAKAQLDETQTQLDSLDQGKAALFQAAQQMGMPETDGSDQAALELIAMLSQLSPEATAQFAPLQAGLEALAAQGSDTSAARTALEAGLTEYQQGLSQAQASRGQLDQNQYKLNAQLAQLNSQQAQLDAQKAELDQAEITLQTTIRDTEAQLASAERELADGQAEYDDGMAKLEEAKQELADGWQEYYDGKAEANQELADAAQKLDDAQAEIDDIQPGEWYIFTRSDNTGFSSYAANADKIAAIAKVFPVFFFLVAALVALTTMTRMVEEERQQIGTMKALGYSSVQIAGKYLLYAALASLFGCVFGVAAGMWLFPTVIINAYNIMYDLPTILTPFSWTLAIISAVTATLCTLAATLNACWNALREVPARLMLPKAPKAGKRVFLELITPLWSRMKFTQKVTARNLIRYKKRFFMTVTGIAGCTALLVTGFGIRDSVSDIVGIQYGELAHYELLVGLKHETALDGQALRDILNDESLISGYLPVLQDSGSVVPQDGDPADDITIFVPSQVERLPEFFTFRHRTGGESISYDESSVIITEKLAERQHLDVGDTITVRNQNETEASFTITDICENYVHHYLYISPTAYQETFDEAPEVNSILCKLPEEGPFGGVDNLTTSLLKCTDVALTTSTVELSNSFNNSIQSINYIVVVLIISAGALAFVVVYNLTNINITERVKELATIKVLGFYEGEVAAYVYRETAVLTLIGTGAGLLLGIALHQFVIRTAEVDMVMFGRAIYAPSFIWATLLTIVFSIMVNLVMFRKLKAIDMVESMKAPE